MCIALCSDVVREMPLGDFFDELYTFALKMNSLGLTDGETGVLTAIMIMNPGQLDAIHSSSRVLVCCL